jgi:hypothetical protein
MEYQWKRPFQNLSVPVSFEAAEKTTEFITAHLNRLEQTTKVVLFITDTLTVEKYALAAQRQIESNMWTWIVFTKDTLPFKCLQCQDAQIYWLRVIKSTSSEELSNFSDFVWSEELETQFLYSRNTWNNLQTSYCLDIIYTALDFLIGLNDTRVYNENDKKGKTVEILVTPRGNVTLRELLERNKDYDFGYYVNQYAHYYYQVGCLVEKLVNKVNF